MKKKNGIRNFLYFNVSILLISELLNLKPLLGMRLDNFGAATPHHRAEPEMVPILTSAEPTTPDGCGRYLLGILKGSGKTMPDLSDLQRAYGLLRTPHLLEVDVNVQDSEGKTALHLVVSAYKPPFTRLIIKIIAALRLYGSKLGTPDRTGRTAAQYVIDAYNRPGQSPTAKQDLQELARALDCEKLLLDVTDYEDSEARPRALRTGEPEAQGSPKDHEAPTPQNHNAGDVKVSDLSESGESDT